MTEDEFSVWFSQSDGSFEHIVKSFTFSHFASIPTGDGEICVNNWDSDEVYNGFYSKYSKAENFFLEERDNVCNFINIYIEECEVM